LDPRNIKARQRYVDILRFQGRTKEARLEIEQAIKQYPAAAALRVTRAFMLYQQGEYDEAFVEARRAADLTNLMPAYPMALWVQGLCLEQKGQVAEAESTFGLALTHQPHAPWVEPSLGHLFARTDRTEKAKEMLAELRSQLDRGRLTYAAQALVYTALGHMDEALQSLERGLNERDDAILSVLHDPRLRPLRFHPRFHKILERLSSRS
jgi:tetratricopeptide (TPR) repeat protein